MFAERTNWNLAPNRLSEALAAHLAAGKRLYDLSASNPTEVGFTVNAEGACCMRCKIRRRLRTCRIRKASCSRGRRWRNITRTAAMRFRLRM